MGEKYYVIGGASIFCARSVLEVWPIWPPHLERLFALSEAEFSKCSSTLLATYEEAEGKSQEPKSTKEVLEFLEVCKCSDVLHSFYRVPENPGFGFWEDAIILSC